MYTITKGSSQNLTDVLDFLNLLDNLKNSALPHARGLFSSGHDLIVTRAPGRLDVMGGIADYSGSLVLELPLKEATLVALQLSDERTLKIVSINPTSDDEIVFEMHLNDFEDGGAPLNYEAARRYFGSDSSKRWAAYVAGAYLVLMHERQISFPQGARMLVFSRVPEGKGVSSSAALEVAAMQAVCAAYSIALEPIEVAILCQKAENLIAGAPCGIMDQTTSVCGEADQLLALLCQPAELKGIVAVPNQIRFWGLDSGVRHSVAGADYGAVRAGAFIGYRMIAEMAGLAIQDTEQEAVCKIDDPQWRGYLANMTPVEFQKYANSLPDEIRGDQFLSRYRCTTDPISRIVPDRVYPVRVAASHPVYEHVRVQTFAKLLAGSLTDDALREMGELMFQSHQSYSACGLNSDGTDMLVSLVKQLGPKQGLYGAKITGGGSGGTVAVLARYDAGQAITSVAEEYARRSGYNPFIFEGSSCGSAAFGHMRLVLHSS
jgi:L-arabinokinase